MISYEEAIKSILSKADLLETEEVALEQARGRHLAEDIFAPIDSPRFDNSAVDGYAVKIEDVRDAREDKPVVLRIAGEVRAGDKTLELEPVCAISIFTGAPVHASHEAIVMKEFCRREGDNVHVLQPVKLGENIRRAGEEYRKGDRILQSGIEITSRTLGVLASIGTANVHVHKLPRVSLIVSGNELVDRGDELLDGQIYDSNSIALRALLGEWGLCDVKLMRCSDTLEEITSEIETAARTSDVIVTVGGASVGDYDFVKEAAVKAGFSIHHDKVAIKPGKPNLFGAKNNTLFFGLPGNPVSAFVSLLLFVKPALRKMMGARDPANKFLNAILASDLRKKAGRLEFVRVKVEASDEGLVAIPVKGQDSHMMLGLAKADGLLLFDRERDTLKVGEICRVILL
ncbi:molybdopterin molybdotransferase MoeA [bacterium]|nr:molybdopterin molybdotransferase MoeA [bacterium]